MPVEQQTELTGSQKSAILIVGLGTDISAKVLKELNEAEIEKITVEVANLRDIPPKTEDMVLKEVSQLIMAQEYINQGGVEYAKNLLETAVGKNKALEILKRLEGSLKASGFAKIKNIDPKQLVNFIQNEHPQTISLILTQLSHQQAAQVLSDLSPELQSEVAFRIATMEKISPEIINELEVLLEDQFEMIGTRDLSISGGTKMVAEILNLMESSTEKAIIESIENERPELAAEIKNLMFVFEDIILLDDRSIQRVLKDVETKDLAIALKAASEELKVKIFSNVSERVGEMIKEEIEFMGPMRLSDVEAAQQRIVEVIRRLQDEGQIIIAGRGGKEELVV
ncbi:MAG: flagellar motor switch protein FliG [candidate division Zixibacteria bacterium]|jgi:flagellar motor switch protein FliG|nr:flagellar motor switch protein FliG [candidate division Zixibacteria bacterium]